MGSEPSAPDLPPWAEASPRRQDHMARVSELMGAWAEEMGLPAAEVDRWRRAGWLHDCLRDADSEALRTEVPADLRDLPGPALHGPAAAERLAPLVDPEMADAIRYHTFGHPGWGKLGRALYLADYLEPGRKWNAERRAELRSRVPGEFDAVLAEVVAERLSHTISKQQPLRRESVAFWNALVAASP